MLTTGHVVFHEMFVSVDKLEAVPILCVSALFCMNASQRVKYFCGELFSVDFVLIGT